MAACDNLYGNMTEWVELHEFLHNSLYPEYIELYMRDMPDSDQIERRICYIAEIQEWLYDNCPLPWVKERLKDNFNIQAMICGKPHHEKEDDED